MATVNGARWDWDDTWQAFLMATIAVAIAVVIAWARADKSIHRYYIDGLGASSNTVCVMADASWWADSVVWCTSEVEKAATFAKNATDAIAARAEAR